MKENYQVNDGLYKCDVTSPLSKKMYIALAERERKSSFFNHKLSFEQNRYSYKTTFSGYMLRLKSGSSKTPNLKWSILRCVPPYSNISKKCLFCLYKRLEILA